MWMSRLLAEADNLVVGIWLYFRAKENRYRPVLWLLFGFMVSLLGALLYLVIRVHESNANEMGDLDNEAS